MPKSKGKNDVNKSKKIQKFNKLPYNGSKSGLALKTPKVFQSLPPEMRLAVYEAMSPGPQIITLFLDPNRRKLKRANKDGSEAPDGWIMSLKTDARTQVLFHISQEARAFAMKRWRPCLEPQLCRPVYIDLERDTLHIQNKDAMDFLSGEAILIYKRPGFRWEGWTSSRSRLPKVQAEFKILRNNLRYLAVGGLLTHLSYIPSDFIWSNSQLSRMLDFTNIKHVDLVRNIPPSSWSQNQVLDSIMTSLV